MNSFPEWFKDEVWKPIAAYNGNYEVSNKGNFRRIGHNAPRGSRCGGKMDYTLTAKTLKVVTGRAGYLYVSIKSKFQLAHRIVALTFIPNPENKPQVNHIDNNPKNCDAANLEWCTQSENLKHAYRQGRLKQLKKKLTEEQVREIKASPKSISSLKLCKKYNISSSVIRHIRQGATWKHI